MWKAQLAGLGIETKTLLPLYGTGLHVARGGCAPDVLVYYIYTIVHRSACHFLAVDLVTLSDA